MLNYADDEKWEYVYIWNILFVYLLSEKFYGKSKSVCLCMTHFHWGNVKSARFLSKQINQCEFNLIVDLVTTIARTIVI